LIDDNDSLSIMENYGVDPIAGNFLDREIVRFLCFSTVISVNHPPRIFNIYVFEKKNIQTPT